MLRLGWGFDKTSLSLVKIGSVTAKILLTLSFCGWMDGGGWMGGGGGVCREIFMPNPT